MGQEVGTQKRLNNGSLEGLELVLHVVTLVQAQAPPSVF